MPENVRPRPKRLLAESILAELKYDAATEQNAMSPQSRRSTPLGEFPRHLIKDPSLSLLIRSQLDVFEKGGTSIGNNEALAPWSAGDGTWQPQLKRDLMDTAGSIGHGSQALPLELALRPPTVLSEAGAVVAEYAKESDLAPSITTGASTSWVANGETVAAQKLAFQGANLGHSLLVSRIRVSRRLFLQAGDHEASLRAELQAAIRSSIEAAAFAGPGGVAPLGLLNSTAIASAAITSTPTKAELTALAEPILKVAPAPNITIFLSADNFDSLTVGATPVVLPVDGRVGEYHVAGISTVFTAHLPTGQALVGDFSKFTIAFFDRVALIVDPYSEGASGQVSLTAQQHVGMAARHTGAFRRGLS